MRLRDLDYHIKGYRSVTNIRTGCEEEGG